MQTPEREAAFDILHAAPRMQERTAKARDNQPRPNQRISLLPSPFRSVSRSAGMFGSCA